MKLLSRLSDSVTYTCSKSLYIWSKGLSLRLRTLWGVEIQFVNSFDQINTILKITTLQ